MMQHLAIWLTCVCAGLLCALSRAPGLLLVSAASPSMNHGHGTVCQLNSEHITTYIVADDSATLKEKLKIMVIALDNHLTMDSQVRDICRSPFYHTRTLRQMRPVITDEVVKTSACSFVTSRFDYAISVLHGKWPLNESCCVCGCLVAVEYS